MRLRGEFRKRAGLVASSLLILMLAFSLLAPAAMAGKPIQTPGVPDHQPGWGWTAAPKGVVSVAQPLAAKAGAEMLAKGGNAIDAAAAIQFALNVEEPMMTGIGGGAFIMIYSVKDKKVFVIDSRERAPFKAKPDQFLNPDGTETDFYKTPSLLAARVMRDRGADAARLRSVDIVQPSLEAAYLSLTGRTTNEDEEVTDDVAA